MVWFLVSFSSPAWTSVRERSTNSCLGTRHHPASPRDAFLTLGIALVEPTFCSDDLYCQSTLKILFVSYLPTCRYCKSSCCCQTQIGQTNTLPTAFASEANPSFCCSCIPLCSGNKTNSIWCHNTCRRDDKGYQDFCGILNHTCSSRSAVPSLENSTLLQLDAAQRNLHKHKVDSAFPSRATLLFSLVLAECHFLCLYVLLHQIASQMFPLNPQCKISSVEHRRCQRRGLWVA